MLRRYRQIISLGLPILIGQLGMIVVGFADTYMVGQYSTEALAAASFVNNVFNMALLACIGFAYGMTPIVGALFTRGRYAEIGASVRAGVVANTIYAALVSLIMTGVYLSLDHLGQPAELLPIIRPYYLTYLAGVVPVTLFNVFAQWSYAINRTRMPMWITLACNAINIGGNWLLIYGRWGLPEMGLTGAGIATLAARCFGTVAIISVFCLKPCFRPYRKGFAKIRAGRRRLVEMVRMSFPISLQMALESGSFSAAGVMVGWISAVALASYQIIVIIGTLGFCVYYSMAAAVSVLVANAAGRGDTVEMRRTAFAGYRILLTLATIASGVFIVLGYDMIHLFTYDSQVLALTVTLIVPLVLYQYGDATQINFANALRGTSRVKVMSWIAFVSYCVVGLPATYLLAFPLGLGVYGIVLSFSVSLFTAAGLFLYYFLRYTSPKTA